MKNLTALALAAASLTLISTYLPVLAASDDNDAQAPSNHIDLDGPGAKVHAADHPPAHKENYKGDGPRVQEYDEIVAPDMQSAWQMAERARVSLRNGNVSRAMSLATKAIKMNDDDIDAHMILAQAMEAKLERQPEKDPDLFKKCVHEYLLVYRNEVGMEKGMTWKGLNLAGTYYNDDEHGTLCKKALVKLTGYAPRLWETDNHFINRVTRPTETAVSAKLRRDRGKEQ